MLDLEYIKKYFENKTVILVGPANNLINENNGKFIDSFDIVCRLNDSYIISDDKKNDYGTRCDVLFNTCNCQLLCIMKRHRHYLKNCSIVINPTSETHRQDYNNTKKNVYQNYLDINLDIPFYQVEDKYEKTMDKGLNTGMCSLYFLLDCLNVKHLYICGFSFHGVKEKKYLYENKTKSYETYLFDSNKVYSCNCSHKSPCKKRTDKKYALVTSELKQLNYFKDVTNEFKNKVTLDKTITKLL